MHRLQPWTNEVGAGEPVRERKNGDHRGLPLLATASTIRDLAANERLLLFGSVLKFSFSFATNGQKLEYRDN